MVQDLDEEELRDQTQMMINQMSRDEKLTILQDLGRSVMQEK
jgi:isopropylmalate/homocitrate/citramalate synthase